ncbi:MAG: hypothetical protein ABSC30_11895 [Acidimicrobiales bacterium]|jgi:hypothetical protein
MSDLVALKVILANVEARLVVALAEGREMDAGIFGALAEDVHVTAVTLERASTLSFRLGQRH